MSIGMSFQLCNYSNLRFLYYLFDLFRALEESLRLSTSASGSEATATASAGLEVVSTASAASTASVAEAGEDPIMKALEWSRREAEERRIREEQEEDEFQKILALSLIEK